MDEWMDRWNICMKSFMLAEWQCGALKSPSIFELSCDLQVLAYTLSDDIHCVLCAVSSTTLRGVVHWNQ